MRKGERVIYRTKLGHFPGVYWGKENGKATFVPDAPGVDGTVMLLRDGKPAQEWGKGTFMTFLTEERFLALSDLPLPAETQPPDNPMRLWGVKVTSKPSVRDDGYAWEVNLTYKGKPTKIAAYNSGDGGPTGVLCPPACPEMDQLKTDLMAWSEWAAEKYGDRHMRPTENQKREGWLDESALEIWIGGHFGDTPPNAPYSFRYSFGEHNSIFLS